MSVHEKMTELADAVRDLAGGTDLLTLEDMIQSIRSAGASDIISTAEGDVIYLTDSAARRLHGLTLYGRTTQNGSPTPETPAAPESAGNSGSITVNVDAQTLTISTPNGLPGIAVASDGNCTDANGQQWLCDEIDFARGTYVRRILKVVFDGSDDEAWYASSTNNSATPRMMTDLYKSTIVGNTNVGTKPNGICSHYSVIPAGSTGTWGCKEGCSVAPDGAVHFFDAEYTTAETWKAFLTKKPITCLFQLVTPMEADLNAEELVAYSALHTNYPQTVIHNDSGAWMAVKYAADTKTYIDNQVAEVASAIVNNV